MDIQVVMLLKDYFLFLKVCNMIYNDLQIFIFSWRGQYENAVRLEQQLEKIANVIVINSDDDFAQEHWINIGNDCYFSKQFKRALSEFDMEKYSFFCHIQADASFDNWEKVFENAFKYHKKYDWGVFAPNVDDTFYISERTDIFDLEDGLTVVANTDNTCWIIHKDQIKTLKDNIYLMDHNELGWGWDLLICSFSHLSGKRVLRDYSLTVDHPVGTGYKKEQAEQEMFDMYNKCPVELKKCIFAVKTSPKSLFLYYSPKEYIFKEDSNQILIYDTEQRV